MNAKRGATTIPIRWVVPPAVDGVEVIVRLESSLDSEPPGAGTLLLVSEDAALLDGLCLAAAEKSLSVVQVQSLRGATEQADRFQLVASLVDLDLPGDAGWQVAEWLLGHKLNNRILILSGRVEHHELSAAIRSGVVFEKSVGAARLLRAVGMMLEESAQQVNGRHTLKQFWLCRARPDRGEDTSACGYQHWGIND